MYDALIIGGGVAGLTAATYLGRFRRHALVLDGGSSRAQWIPESHNIPGFPSGVSGEELLCRLKAQAAKYGAEFHSGWVSSIARRDSDFAIELAGQTVRSRYVILATGVEDHLPALEGAPEALLRSILRVCPICDGFEALDKRIAVIGDGDHGEREAEFLRTYSEHVCYVHVAGSLDPKRQQRLRGRGIDVIEAKLEQLRIRENALEITSPQAMGITFDVFYGALGCSPRVALAQALGARRDDNSALQVNAHQQTSVDGLYAAGDVVKGLNQMVVASAEAAIASTDIHNRLRT